MDKLTPKQKSFADYYIELGNATEAYRKAGYAVKSDAAARANASRLLTNANVKSYIEQRMKELESEQIASQEEVLRFLTSVLRGEITEEVPLLVGEGMQELSSKDVSIKDRVKAAELLGKRYAMWTEKQQVEGSQQVIFVEDLDE
ncbi:terminase small subunit [Weizmannia sp. FSL K6-0777]|uniref:terminase small subunit n=1 Tax=Heyndrickxia TaxID=2837504 RepID=UPI002E201CE0|nr:terminase small subunit [Weizmannia sp. CD-2023]